jgi:hypothetical protein
MDIKPYIGWVIWATVFWLAAVLAVYGMFYFVGGIEFWHPLR